METSLTTVTVRKTYVKYANPESGLIEEMNLLGRHTVKQVTDYLKEHVHEDAVMVTKLNVDDVFQVPTVELCLLRVEPETETETEKE